MHLIVVLSHYFILLARPQLPHTNQDKIICIFLMISPCSRHLSPCFFGIKIVARWWLKAWSLDTRGFIPKKIQWHIHAGPWSLVNCMAGSLYEALYKVLMNINESGCRPYGWPRPWWWSVYPRDTPTSPFLHERRGFACMQRNYC